MRYRKLSFLKIKLINTLFRIYDYIKCRLSGTNLIIHGSCYNTNVGDRAIAVTIKNELLKKGIKSTISSRFSINPPVTNIIVAGGGVIHNINKDNLKWRTDFINDKRNIFYVGIGCYDLGEFSPEEKLQLEKMLKAKYISVRDKESFSECNDIFKSQNSNIELGVCPSWLFKENINIKDISLRNYILRLYFNIKYKKNICSNKNLFSKKETTIGLSLRYSSFIGEKYHKMVINKIRELSKDNNLVFIPFAFDDLRFYKNELSHLKIKCVKLQSAVDTFKTVGRMDKMIATRYHSLIFSLLNIKPVMILGYHLKVISLAKELKLKYFDLMKGDRNDFVFNQLDISLIEEKKKIAREQQTKLLHMLVYG